MNQFTTQSKTQQGNRRRNAIATVLTKENRRRRGPITLAAITPCPVEQEDPVQREDNYLLALGMITADIERVAS